MNTTQETEQTQEVIIPNFGDGRYSPFMKEVWQDAQAIFGFNSEDAELLARKAASDLGNIMKFAKVELSFGKTNKDNKLSIREVSKMKNVTATYAISLVKALSWANDAVANGFNRNQTDWVMTQSLAQAWENLKTPPPANASV